MNKTLIGLKRICFPHKSLWEQKYQHSSDGNNNIIILYYIMIGFYNNNK
jgi:hypothetical protein